MARRRKRRSRNPYPRLNSLLEAAHEFVEEVGGDLEQVIDAEYEKGSGPTKVERSDMRKWNEIDRLLVRAIKIANTL